MEEEKKRRKANSWLLQFENTENRNKTVTNKETNKQKHKSWLCAESRFYCNKRKTKQKQLSKLWTNKKETTKKQKKKTKTKKITIDFKRLANTQK